MANAVMLSFRCVGTQGQPKVVPVWLPSATTLAASLAFAQAFVPLLEDCVDPYVQRASVDFELDISGQTKGAADASTRTNDGVRFQFDTAGRYNHGVWFPGWKPALLSDTDIVVNATTNALKAAFVDGLGGTLPEDGNGNDLTAFVKAAYAYRK